jgi:hypothetical protein
MTQTPDINTSADYGEAYLVQVTYNSDPENNRVPFEDASNITLHGPFDTKKEADDWIMAYPEDSRDVRGLEIVVMNRVREVLDE